jgi:hypothetical protein
LRPIVVGYAYVSIIKSRSLSQKMIESTIKKEMKKRKKIKRRKEKELIMEYDLCFEVSIV